MSILSTMSERQSSKHTLKNSVIMDILFPLPTAPPDQCRDAYLKELLPPREDLTRGSLVFEETPSDDGILSTEVLFSDDSNDAEARMVGDFIKHRNLIGTNKPLRKSVFQDDKFRTSALTKMLRDRYGSIAKAIGCVAVLFQIIQVKRRMAVVHEMWKEKSNVDNSIRMFSWSIKDYFMRLNFRDTIYLDTIELELKDQMDCFKFCMDLKEVIRLVDAVHEDIKAKRDICSSSMLAIKDVQVDIMELMLNSQREAEAQISQLTKDVQQTQRPANRGRQAKNISMDFLVPIEARYKINWAQATMEQSILYDDYCEREISDQLNYFKENLMEVLYFFDNTKLAYILENNNFKQRIDETEQAYEENMELVDNEITLTRNKLNKIKDDLAFCMDQVPMFHQKIAEVKEILAKQEEEAKQVQERISTRVSKRSSKKKRKKTV